MDSTKRFICLGRFHDFVIANHVCKMEKEREPERECIVRELHPSSYFHPALYAVLKEYPKEEDN